MFQGRERKVGCCSGEEGNWGWGKRFAAGATFVGEINQKGRKHGVGLEKSEKMMFVGSFKDGEKHGKGWVKQRENGPEIHAHWSKGEKDGHVRWRNEESEKFEGEVKKGVRHGKGKEVSKNGSKYLGEFWEGEKCGLGKMTLKNGTVYVGEWKNSRKDGYGFSENDHGVYFFGQWKNDLPNGLGVEVSRTGTYKGEFMNGKFHGLGIFRQNDPSVNEAYGQFLDGKLVNFLSEYELWRIEQWNPDIKSFKKRANERLQEISEYIQEGQKSIEFDHIKTKEILRSKSQALTKDLEEEKIIFLQNYENLVKEAEIFQVVAKRIGITIPDFPIINNADFMQNENFFEDKILYSTTDRFDYYSKSDTVSSSGDMSPDIHAKRENFYHSPPKHRVDKISLLEAELSSMAETFSPNKRKIYITEPEESKIKLTDIVVIFLNSSSIERRAASRVFVQKSPIIGSLLLILTSLQNQCLV